VIGRRDLLVRTGLLLAASAFAGLPATPRRRALAADDWAALRDQFDLSRDLVHMGGLYIASHPAPVRAAIEAHRRGLDEDPVGYLQERGGRNEARVLAAAAAYLGAGTGDLALTDSTTMGLGLLYPGLAVRADQEILTTTHDFWATHEALRTLSARTGAPIRSIELYSDPAAASVEAIVGAVEAALTGNTRVVAVTWVHSSTGVKLPIARIAEVVGVANRGRDEADMALLCVDGVHGIGVEDASVTELGCDFFVAGCHKWLFGPRGTGIVWGHPQSWRWADGAIPSFSDRRTPGGAFTPGGFHSFEHRWALNEAFDLHTALGKARVQARVHELAGQVKAGLAAMRGVRLHTPIGEDVSAGIVCFDVEGQAAATVVRRLRAAGVVATVTPYSPPHARLAPGLFNSAEDVEVALAAVRALA
jgi:isopenicillin-N epimerase